MRVNGSNSLFYCFVSSRPTHIWEGMHRVYHKSTPPFIAFMSRLLRRR